MIEFASEDMEAFGVVTDIEEIRNCHNPYDLFALHKAALIACGIIPTTGEASFEEILTGFGGGIFLSTQVVGIPKGSRSWNKQYPFRSVRKSSFPIFWNRENTAGNFCYRFLYGADYEYRRRLAGSGGRPYNRRKAYQHTTRGRTEHSSGACDNRRKGKEELQERFALIYTGQRRLARNLLRDVVGGYIGSRPESVRALKEMQSLAVLMRFEAGARQYRRVCKAYESALGNVEAS